ncbi:MAG: adaptor protein MecA [Oscillospiraceae bacterium]|nr:adaptor protein MecA [Oscillospiraceae bacterium]
MRIEQIDGNKIKVFISNDDMEKLNIDFQNLSPTSPDLSKSLFKIIEHIKSRTGFNPDSAKMLIEAVHSMDGIMLMLTKADGLGDIVLNKDKMKGKIKSIKAKKKNSSPKYIIYEFSGADAFFDAVKSAEEEWLAVSSAYRMNDRYYIVFTGENIRYRAFLSEFSSGEGYSRMFGIFLKEHASFVAGGSNLVHMAKEIRNFY